jgi:single stranded DNA-binding protein
MWTINKVTLMGKSIQQPNIVTLSSGKRAVNMVIATSSTIKSGEETKRVSEFHSIVSYLPFYIDFIEKNVTKGTAMYLEGELRTNKWEKDGEMKYKTEIHLNYGNVLKLVPIENKTRLAAAPVEREADLEPAILPKPKTLASKPLKKEYDDLMDDEIPF